MTLKSDGDLSDKLVTCRGEVVTVGALTPSVTRKPNGWYAVMWFNHWLGPLADRWNDCKHGRRSAWWEHQRLFCYNMTFCCAFWPGWDTSLFLLARDQPKSVVLRYILPPSGPSSGRSLVFSLRNSIDIRSYSDGEAKSSRVVKEAVYGQPETKLLSSSTAEVTQSLQKAQERGWLRLKIGILVNM